MQNPLEEGTCGTSNISRNKKYKKSQSLILGQHEVNVMLNSF